MFNGKQFLSDHFKKPANLSALLQAYGFTIKEAAVGKWWQRGRIPGDWFPVLLAVRELETGGPVRVSSYLTGGR